MLKTCSADFQSAVSPISSRQTPESSAGARLFGRSAEWNSAIQQIGNLRYALSMLICMTWPIAMKAAARNYAAVDAIFTKHCLDCHAPKDPEGELVLESFDSLMKGGELGAAVIPGKSADSLLVQMIEGRFEKEGKKKIMPPGKRAKLTPAEIAAIKDWIDAGAPAPAVAEARVLNVTRIEPKVVPRRPINAVAYSATAKLTAIAKSGEVELRSDPDLRLIRTLSGSEGNINAVAFSSDGNDLYTAGGQPGWGGDICRWNVAEGKAVKVISSAHKDTIYALALSPDGKVLATGSYDQKIKLWDVATGRELKTLSGHNGCVYGLAFRPDGKILASASADRTVKLWEVESGQRRDTLSQSLKDVYAVAFSPDGKRLFAGGADNRIRVWQISENAAETTNPILHSKFAHEGAILRLVISPDGEGLISCADDQTFKLWDTSTMTQRRVFEKQPDWPSAAAFIGPDQILVGRMDGSLGLYNVSSGKGMIVETAGLK
jgi:dipeptidyl aminopeptidase/acylaminoacyl peptidase